MDCIFTKKRMTERLRFAPSPTGPLHIGGLRTALYNYLYAKKHQGQVVLRIEDTDQTRYVAGAEDYIFNALEWMGIPPDESPKHEGSYGPYRQSERKEVYHEHIKHLVASGKAYYAFDTPDELEALRTAATAKGEVFTYNAAVRERLKNSLNFTEEETQQYLDSGNYVVRLKVTPNTMVTVKDLLRGTITVNSATLDDKVLMKADGLPTYHFANVVDDHLMAITTVIRGEEWLPSLALHQLLYDAFAWESPKFIHLPLILKSEGKGKLSKRDGIQGGYPVFPLDWDEMKGFKETGFLPEALRNFLLLIGWNGGTEQEIYTLEEMIAAFDVSGLQKGGGRFDYKKALWMNAQYLQQLPLQSLRTTGAVYLKALEGRYSEEALLQIVALAQPRITFIQELAAATYCFHSGPTEYDEKPLRKIKDRLPTSFFDWCEAHLPNTDVANLKAALQTWCEAEGCGFGVVMQGLRLALVGSLTGPDVMAIIALVGTEELLKRIRTLKEVINN